MNVNELYSWLNFLAKKQLSGAIKPTDYNTGLNAVNIDFFSLKVGLPQEYKPGQPLPRQAYEVTTKITDDLKHLRTRVDIPISSAGFLQPTDYAAFSSMRFPLVTNVGNQSVVTWPDVNILTDENYNDRVAAKLTGPTIKKPIGVYVNGAWEVSPSSIDLVRLTYLRFPATPFRNFTIDPANDEDTYEPTGSTQLDWPVTLHTDFASALAAYWGINLSKADLYQPMANRSNKGQV